MSRSLRRGVAERPRRARGPSGGIHGGRQKLPRRQVVEGARPCRPKRRRRYLRETCRLALFHKKLDHTDVYVQLKYPRQGSTAVCQEFGRLMEVLDKHVRHGQEK